MLSRMRLSFKIIIISMLCMLSSYSFALNLKDRHIVLELGGFRSTQGKSQFIGIDGLIGNNYSVTQHHDYNVLLGLGYYLNGLEQSFFNLWYGIDLFYLPTTEVKGKVIQEELFNNLNFSYHIDHIPIYAALKAHINSCTNKFAITIDFGIGPNINITSHYHEHSLDGGVTIPDNDFSGKTRVTFSTMVGVGIKMNNVFDHVPFECGYRFFYLGQNEFNRKTKQLLSNLKTGQSYANALLCSVSI